MCDRFPGKCDVQTSYKPSNYVLGLIFVVNIKFLSNFQQQKNSIVEIGLQHWENLLSSTCHRFGCKNIYIIISIYVIKALFFLFSLTLFPIKYKRSSP